MRGFVRDPDDGEGTFPHGRTEHWNLDDAQADRVRRRFAPAPQHGDPSSPPIRTITRHDALSSSSSSDRTRAHCVAVVAPVPGRSGRWSRRSVEHRKVASSEDRSVRPCHAAAARVVDREVVAPNAGGQEVCPLVVSRLLPCRDAWVADHLAVECPRCLRTNGGYVDASRWLRETRLLFETYEPRQQVTEARETSPRIVIDAQRRMPLWRAAATAAVREETPSLE